MTSAPPTVRLLLPAQLRSLAGISGELRLPGGPPGGPVTQMAVLDALEERYPVLRGTIRDPTTKRRRPFLRLFAGVEDVSHEPPDAELPAAVREGREALAVVTAIAGG